MSTVIEPKAETEEQIRRQLKEVTEPHEKSCQALGDISVPNHNDGEALHQHFGIPPLHKYLHRASEKGAPVATFPRAFVDMIVHTGDRDLELLEGLVGEVDYDPNDPHPSHEALERYPRYRAKMLEWIADDPRRVRAIRAVGGTDMFMHGEPGGGKTTLALSTALWRMQVNNETFIWGESVDESGTNERTEWLAFAPFATIAIPSGLDTRVRIVPENVQADSFEVDVEEIARDVIRYESIQDLMSQLMPGQFYVMFPDPLHRGADEVSKHNYFDYKDVTPVGEDGPNEATDADQWWFAFIAHRISGDVFPHPTFINLDETGNILDPDAEKDIHEHYQKIKWFRDKYADARKKSVSFGYQAHALGEVATMGRQKIRWRVTMPGNKPPIGRTLPGDRSCPLETDMTSSMEAGEAVIWKAPYFAPIKWPNLKRQAKLDAEVSIDFLDWQEAMG
jgi:hypothetical protein